MSFFFLYSVNLKCKTVRVFAADFSNAHLRTHRCSRPSDYRKFTAHSFYSLVLIIIIIFFLSIHFSNFNLIQCRIRIRTENRSISHIEFLKTLKVLESVLYKENKYVHARQQSKSDRFAPDSNEKKITFFFFFCKSFVLLIRRNRRNKFRMTILRKRGHSSAHVLLIC